MSEPVQNTTGTSNDENSAASEVDFARVSVDTPFDAIWLQKFLDDPERILRINSLMEFKSFESLGENRWHMVGRNLANDHGFDVNFYMERRGGSARFIYDGWLKTSTQLRIESNGQQGARLVITDDYSGFSPTERRRRLAEVDTSIVQWGHDIHRYLRNWKRWSWLPGWKSYMRRFWQGMKPSARRISFMLIAITALELILFLFVIAIFWLELPGLLG